MSRGLTPQERHVAILAAALSSREIAPRTVDNHLAHVYQKLGIASDGCKCPATHLAVGTANQCDPPL
jgi:DNA-binding NarL/FixJ family response regulator